MILNRVRIEGYQTLRNPVELQGLGLGVHLIHGPNTTGKSTLISAIARAFFDRYSTSDQEIRALRPWGTELAPRVTLEFEARGKRFRLDKKFLDEESSSLSEWSGTRFERTADSVKADEQVRDLLFATAAVKGAAGLDNWGLARLLWMTQNSSRLNPPALDETLRQRLLAVLGSTVLSDAEQGLLARLEQAYEIYYTAAKQSEKKGSPLADARERLARAEAVLSACKAKWDDATLLNETVAQSESRLSQAAAERTAAEKAILELRSRASIELELENRIKLKEQELLRAQSRWKELSSLQAELRSMEALIQQKNDEINALEPGQAQAELNLKAASSIMAERLAQARERALELGALSRKMEDAAVVSELMSLRQKNADLAELLARAGAIEAERLAKVEVHKSKKRPKESDLTDARALDQECRALSKRIEDLGIEVRFVAERAGLGVQWSTGEPESDQRAALEVLAAGQEAVFKSADSGELVIPGVGTIQVRSGAEDSRKLKTRLNEIGALLEAKLAHFSVISTEELAVLWQETTEIETEGKALRSALDSALKPSFKTIADLKAEAERTQLLWTQRLGGADDELTLIQAPDLAALKAELNRARLTQEQTERMRQLAETDERRLKTELDSIRLRLEKAVESKTLFRGQLETKLTASGGPLRIATDLSDALGAKDALALECELLLQKLPSIQERASAQLALRERQLVLATQCEQQAQQDLDRKAAVLQSAEAEGYYSKLAAAEEEHALAADLLRETLSRAQGTRVLRQLAQIRRTRMNSGLMAPIEGAVTRIFERIHGPLGSTSQATPSLSFSPDLKEIGVKIPPSQNGGLSATGASLDSLSLGTREQVVLAMRLALGELLAELGEDPEPQLIVLDDPLVNADLGRHERALEVLREASKKLQILIFTARPEAYRALSPKEYDLVALKNQTL